MNVNNLKQIFQKTKNLPRDDEGYFVDLEMHQALYEAIIDVGQNKIYELKDEIYLYLNDPYTGFREEAVITLGWTTSLAIPEFCSTDAYQIWLNDSNDDVRNAALLAWSWYYISIKDSKYLNELLAILKKVDFSKRTRIHALKRIFDACQRFSNVEQIHSLFALLEIEDPKEFEESLNVIGAEQIVREQISLWENKDLVIPTIH